MAPLNKGTMQFSMYEGIRRIGTFRDYVTPIGTVPSVCCILNLPWRLNSRKMSPRRGGMQLLDRIIVAIRISSAFPLPHSMYCL